MSLSEMALASLHQILSLFLCLRAHGAIWGLIYSDVEGLGGWEAAGTGYPFPDLDQSVCEQQGLGLPALTAAPWTVAKRMIELEKAREGSFCSGKSHSLRKLSGMCVYNHIDKLLYLRN